MNCRDRGQRVLFEIFTQSQNDNGPQLGAFSCFISLSDRSRKGFHVSEASDRVAAGLCCTSRATHRGLADPGLFYRPPLPHGRPPIGPLRALQNTHPPVL